MASGHGKVSIFNQAWFGVPAGNFFGWLLVSLAFSGCTRVAQKHIKNVRFRVLVQIFLVPLVAFALYRGAEALVNQGAAAFGWDAEDPATDTLALIGFFVVFAGVVLASRWRAIEYSILCQTNDTVLWFSHACRVSFMCSLLQDCGYCPRRRCWRNNGPHCWQ
jgi:hypothetical protein